MLRQCDKTKQFVLTTLNLSLVAVVRIFLQHELQSGCTDNSQMVLCVPQSLWPKLVSDNGSVFNHGILVFVPLGSCASPGLVTLVVGVCRGPAFRVRSTSASRSTCWRAGIVLLTWTSSSPMSLSTFWCCWWPLLLD